MRVLCSTLAVPWTALFWTDTSDAVSGICWSHFFSSRVTALDASVTTGTTLSSIFDSVFPSAPIYFLELLLPDNVVH